MSIPAEIKEYVDGKHSATGCAIVPLAGLVVLLAWITAGTKNQHEDQLRALEARIEKLEAVKRP